MAVTSQAAAARAADIPSVERLLAAAPAVALLTEYGRSRVLGVVRNVLSDARQQALQGKLTAERCEDRLVRLQSRLDDLRSQEAELSLAAPHEAAQAATAAEVAEIANVLEAVASEGDPRKAKALLQLLIEELRVNSRAEILPTYRLVTPEVCAMSEKVERAGIEPATSSLQSWRSPS